MTEPRVFEGLEGVLVARTQLSEVDGAGGRLKVRGHAIEALAGELPFEAIWGLLLDGVLPDAAELERRRAELGAARVRAHAALAPRFTALCSSEAMTTLRTALSTLPGGAAASDVLGTAAVASAHWFRTQRGEQLL